MMIKRKRTLDDQEGEAGGALLLKKAKWLGQMWPPRRVMGRPEFERIESIAKEGVGQSQICSGLHQDLTVGREKNMFYCCFVNDKITELCS